jgi:hypothetical protein
MTPLARRYRSQADHELERQVSAMLTPAEMAQLTGDLEAIGLTSPTTGETSEDSLFSERMLRAGVGHAPGSGSSQSSDEPSGAVFWMIGAWVVSLLILAGTDIWEKML